MGTDKIRPSLTVGPGGDTFSGVFVSEARDASGHVVFSASGTVQGSRLTLEPLP